MQFLHPMDALGQFELVRRVIGHTALAGNMAHLRRRWDELAGQPDQLLTVLSEYHEQAAAAAGLVAKPSRPLPVMPDVQASNGLVRYITISGATVFRADLRVATLTMTRPGTAIHVSSGERCAMAILTGFLGGGTLPQEPGQFADPRPSARKYLTRKLDKARADALVDAYGEPNWHAWQLEYDVAMIEIRLAHLRGERTRLHTDLGLVEPA